MKTHLSNYSAKFFLFFFIILNLPALCSANLTKKERLPVNSTNDYLVLQYNNISMPLDNKGILGDINSMGGRYNSNIFLFSGGFFLSGKLNNTLWANGVFSSSRINDYLPGPVGSIPSESKNKIYFVSKYDAPFGSSWQAWKDAVALGADFYDGDNDGVYFPVDKNGNGIWDSDEDRPDLVGDFTAWCVYNDGLADLFRKFNNVTPKGIEVQQTVFGFTSNYILKNALFIKYKITYKGSEAARLDSVYFSVACDPDLGNGADDFVGCDTVLNSGYVYNNGPDNIFGNNPPVFLVGLLQGPVQYIPNVTYSDKNNNDVFDKDIDIALKTAYNFKGSYIGIDTIPGAMNLPMVSFTEFIQSHPTLGDPSSVPELRYYMQGGTEKEGTPINPCTWSLGNGSSLTNCSNINPKFIYSGDPAIGKGWINTTPTDQRFLLNTGSFTLEKNKPVTIIADYIIGDGGLGLVNISMAKAYATVLKNYYTTNYTTITDIKKEAEQVKSYELQQNYPNPFNPTTVIKYQIPVANKVSLKIYDVLGKEVTTLVNGFKEAGKYQVIFDCSRFASGVYVYKLEAGTFIQSKKMIFAK